jgi:Holliday junction resolvase
VSGGRASRQKGNRLERALVHALQDAGFVAERVPLSGAAGGRFGADLSIPLLGADRRVEVKCRGDGFRQLYSWLNNNGADLLIVRADRSEPLVVVPFHFAIEIARAAENSAQAESVPAESGKPNSRMHVSSAPDAVSPARAT